MRDLSRYHYLVDTCAGTKYYVTYERAKEEFYNNPLAHTLAKKIDNNWYPMIEIPSQHLNLN